MGPAEVGQTETETMCSKHQVQGPPFDVTGAIFGGNHMESPVCYTRTLDGSQLVCSARVFSVGRRYRRRALEGTVAPNKLATQSKGASKGCPVEAYR